MKNVTTTLCLTIAVLLGSVGVSWGEDLNGKALECRLEYKNHRQIWVIEENSIAILMVGIEDIKSYGFIFSKFGKVPIIFGKREKLYRKNKKIKWGKGVFGQEFDLQSSLLTDLSRQKRLLGKCQVKSTKRLISNIEKTENAFIPDMKSVMKAGRDRKFDLAVMHLQPLAYIGNSKAQAYLGIFYQSGWGVKKNFQIARRLFLLAAKTEEVAAVVGLGDLYRDGLGVIQDYETAFKYYKIAAEKGDATAQTNLGMAYFTGHGVNKNFVRGHMWLNIASSKGLERALKFRKMLTEKLSPLDLGVAQNLARECVRKKYKGC